MATGTNTSSQSSLGFHQERRRGVVPRGVWADGWPESDGAEGDVMKSIYHISAVVLNPPRRRSQGMDGERRRVNHDAPRSPATKVRPSRRESTPSGIP